MKKLILLLITGAILIGAGMSLSLTHLTVINKSGQEIYVKLDMLDKPSVFYTISLPLGTKEFEQEKMYTIVSGTYEVNAWGVKDGSYTPCFGYADDEYYDENKAKHIMTFGKGARKMLFNEDNCAVQPPEVFKFWQSLADKLYEYNKQLESYLY